MKYNKKGQESPAKGYKYEFLSPKFTKFRIFGMLHPPKGHVVLKVLTKNKVFYFPKSILCVACMQQAAKINPDTGQVVNEMLGVGEMHTKVYNQGNGMQ